MSAAASATDPLDEIALLSSEFDSSALPPLERLKQSHYPSASPQWQRRWHMLRCDIAGIQSDSQNTELQLQELIALENSSPLSRIAIGICQAAHYSAAHEFTSEAETLSSLLSDTPAWPDPNLEALIWLRLGLAQTNISDDSRSLKSFSNAMKVYERHPNSTLITFNAPLMHYGMARLFYKLGNSARTLESYQLALDLVRPGSAMEWFLRFNYANFLNNLDMIEEAGEQLDKLPETRPQFAAADEGYVQMFFTRFARSNGNRDKALEHIELAIAAFANSPNEFGLGNSYIQRGRIRVNQGDQGGWLDVQRGQDIYQKLNRMDRVANVELWNAKYLADQQQYQQAYQALKRYTELNDELMSGEQRTALLKQQQELGEQMDKHRQRLAITAEAHYQGQQSLLLWQSYGIALTILLLFFILWRQIVRRSEQLQPVPVRQPEALMAEAIQQAKDAGDSMPMVLLRLQGEQLDVDQISRQLSKDLRPQDSCLQLNPQDFLLLLPWASDAELNWRFDSLPKQLGAVHVDRYQIGKARLHNFDDVSSILLRLECNLTSHIARNRPQPLSA
ncbi:hypothetical protein [uncultured Ferrimonas sp.]|uniref:hypothetical protein n=1 Tax=uncultured Ferrimonas sp. TaxID=432640 RepID=UPI00262D784C|nr:hypothetical protein [uncultured Ferrimonas sp.]